MPFNATEVFVDEWTVISRDRLDPQFAARMGRVAFWPEVPYATGAAPPKFNQLKVMVERESGGALGRDSLGTIEALFRDVLRWDGYTIRDYRFRSMLKQGHGPHFVSEALVPHRIAVCAQGSLMQIATGVLHACSEVARDAERVVS